MLEHLLDYLDNHDLSDLNLESVYKYSKDRVKNPAYVRHLNCADGTEGDVCGLLEGRVGLGDVPLLAD